MGCIHPVKKNGHLGYKGEKMQYKYDRVVLNDSQIFISIDRVY